jgi:gliding motility-associated-like protein
MKKNIFLLLGLILSLNLLNAADVNHPAQTICETDAKPTFQTNNTNGDKYTWYHKQADNSWKEVSTGSSKYTPTLAGEYKCVVEKSGTTEKTGNLITLGGFEFPADNPKFSETNRLGSNVWYQYLNFDRNGKDIAIGATTTHTNANNVKEKYFTKLKPYEGNYLFVCDGANSSSARVWQAGGIKLPKGKYQFSCHVANIDSAYSSHGTNSLAKLKFVIKNDDGEQELLSFTAPSQLGIWDERKAVFEATKDYSWCDIYIVNFTTEPEGNDFALDEIYFGTEITTTGTKDNEFFELKIDSKPTIKMPTIADPCPNTSVEIKPTVLKVGSSPKYTWSGDATGNLINTTITSASNVGGEKKCSLRVENGKCISTADITIKTKNCGEEKPIPHPQIERCPGVEVELTCTTSITGAQSVKWEHDSSSGQSAKVNAGPNIGDTKDFKCTIVKIEGGKTITYIETFSILTINCTSEKTETHNLSDCPKQEVTLTCTTTADATKDAIVWSHDATLKSTTAIVKTKDTPTAEGTPNTPDTYTCTITKVNEKGETFIYIENFNVTTKNDCIGDNEKTIDVTIGSSVTIESEYWNTTGAIFNWYKVVNGNNVEVSGNIDNPGKLTLTANEYETYVCITSLPNGYIYTETRNIKVHNDIEDDVYICYNDDFSVTATTKNAFEYKWYKTTNDTEVLSSDATLEIKELKQNTSYICRILGADKTTKITETYNVKINPLPEFNIEIKVENATVDITTGTAPFEFSLSNGTTRTVTSYEYTYEELAEDTYTLTITDKNECVNFKEFTISIPKLEPMKYFSPNNDNLNDLWLVYGIETAPNAHIMIYDRHSKLLYKGIGSEFQGWDGNYNGHGMVQDDYWYVIQIPETEETLSGHFILKR